jgi:hypothetical protein
MVALITNSTSQKDYGVFDRFASEKHLVILFVILFISLTLASSPNFFANIYLKCILKEVLGINCPFCGMTRDFILMANGLPPQHNLFSPIFALIIFIIYPVGSVVCIIKRKNINISYRWSRNAFFLAMTSMFIINNIR